MGHLLREFRRKRMICWRYISCKKLLRWRGRKMGMNLSFLEGYWCAHFRAHLSPNYSIESRNFTLVLCIFYSILPYSCLWGVLRSFQVFLEISRSSGTSSRLRHHDRRWDTHFEAFPSIPSLPRRSRKVRRPLNT